MGQFASVNDATVTQGGVYFTPGMYVIKVLATKTSKSARNGRDYFIVECEVVESSNPADWPVGAHASQVIDISNIMGPVNIKAFVCAASDVNPLAEDADAQVLTAWNTALPSAAPWTFEKICEYAIAQNCFEDVILDLECVNIKTKANKDFTKHLWTPRAAA